MSDKASRLGLVRQYLLDVFHNPNSILEAADAVNYVKFNFHEAAKAARSEEDLRRGVKRIGVGAKTIAQLQVFSLECEMVELKIGQMWPVISSAPTFERWFQKRLISPIVAEEDRILGHSSTNIVHTGSGIGSYFDRSADVFRFKVWETVHFPDAKDVPPRFIPSPDEINPPKQRLE